MSPLQAIAVENRLGVVRRRVRRMVENTVRSKATHKRKDLLRDERCKARLAALRAALAVIDQELASVKEPS